MACILRRDNFLTLRKEAIRSQFTNIDMYFADLKRLCAFSYVNYVLDKIKSPGGIDYMWWQIAQLGRAQATKTQQSNLKSVGVSSSDSSLPVLFRDDALRKRYSDSKREDELWGECVTEATSMTGANLEC